MSEYGITADGFIRKPTATILSEVQAAESADFGFDVSQNEQSVLNVLNVNFADAVSSLWKLAENVYFSAFPASATGKSLDAAASMFGVTRNEANKSSFKCCFTGYEGVIIPVGQQVTTASLPRHVYATNSVKVITSAAAKRIVIDASACTEDSVNTLTFYGTTPTATIQCNGTGMEVYVSLRLWAATHAVGGNMSVSKTIDNSSYIIVEYTGGDATKFEVTGDIKIKQMDVIERVYCTEYGYFTVEPSKYATLINPVAGLLSAVGIDGDAVDNGTDADTDESVRLKIIAQLSRRGQSNMAAIKSAVSAVKGVRSVAVSHNPSNSTIDGIPPHSVTIYVAGGEDEDVARAIYHSVPAGITMNGIKDVTITDDGVSAVVTYNEAVMSYTDIYVSYSARTGATLPSDFQEIITRIVEKKMDTAGLSETVYLSDCVTEAMAVVPELSYIFFSTSSTGKTYSDTVLTGGIGRLYALDDITFSNVG